MYLVQLKRGDRWSLRKNQKKDVNSLKAYFFPELGQTQNLTRKLDIFSRRISRKSKVIVSIYSRTVVDSEITALD